MPDRGTMDYDLELAEDLAAGRIEREVRQFAIA